MKIENNHEQNPAIRNSPQLPPSPTIYVNPQQLPRTTHNQPPYRASFTEQQKIPNAVRVGFLRRSNDFQHKNNPLRLPDFVMRNPITSTKCELCQQSYPRDQLDSLGNCTHQYCHTCLNSYCVYKISIMEDVICPKEDCSAQINVNGGVFQGLPQQSKDKYRKTQLWRQTINNPNLRLCPTQNCQGVINMVEGHFQCPSCKIQFCKECQLPQHEGPCDANFQQNFKDWKRCPRCHVFIERTEGCNHMTCRCTHEFCYVCLADWDDQHYNCDNNPFLITERWVEDMPRWKQILVGIGLILLTPLAIAFFLVMLAVGIAISIIAGFFCGPAILMGNNCQCPCLIMIIVCPIAMVIGAVVGFCGSLFFLSMMFCSSIGGYFKMVANMLCPGGDAGRNNGQTVYDN